MKKNAFYAQSGGVTSVINATAAALILETKKHKSKIGKVFAGKNGILGALREELIDTSKENLSAIKTLKNRPCLLYTSPSRRDATLCVMAWR